MLFITSPRLQSEKMNGRGFFRSGFYLPFFWYKINAFF